MKSNLVYFVLLTFLFSNNAASCQEVLALKRFVKLSTKFQLPYMFNGQSPLFNLNNNKKNNDYIKDIKALFKYDKKTPIFTYDSINMSRLSSMMVEHCGVGRNHYFILTKIVDTTFTGEVILEKGFANFDDLGRLKSIYFTYRYSEYYDSIGLNRPCFILDTGKVTVFQTKSSNLPSFIETWNLNGFYGEPDIEKSLNKYGTYKNRYIINSSLSFDNSFYKKSISYIPNRMFEKDNSCIIHQLADFNSSASECYSFVVGSFKYLSDDSSGLKSAYIYYNVLSVSDHKMYRTVTLCTENDSGDKVYEKIISYYIISSDNKEYSSFANVKTEKGQIVINYLNGTEIERLHFKKLSTDLPAPRNSRRRP